MVKIRKTIRIPETYVKIMDKLIELKRGPCYSEITRAALDHLISKDMSLIEKYNVHINGLGTSKPVEVKQKKISDFF